MSFFRALGPLALLSVSALAATPARAGSFDTRGVFSFDKQAVITESFENVFVGRDGRRQRRCREGFCSRSGRQARAVRRPEDRRLPDRAARSGQAGLIPASLLGAGGLRGRIRGRLCRRLTEHNVARIPHGTRDQRRLAGDGDRAGQRGRRRAGRERAHVPERIRCEHADLGRGRCSGAGPRRELRGSADLCRAGRSGCLRAGTRLPGRRVPRRAGLVSAAAGRSRADQAGRLLEAEASRYVRTLRAPAHHAFQRRSHARHDERRERQRGVLVALHRSDPPTSRRAHVRAPGTVRTSSRAGRWTRASSRAMRTPARTLHPANPGCRTSWFRTPAPTTPGGSRRGTGWWPSTASTR